jgi:hypothetical protein
MRIVAFRWRRRGTRGMPWRRPPSRRRRGWTWATGALATTLLALGVALAAAGRRSLPTQAPVVVLPGAGDIPPLPAVAPPRSIVPAAVQELPGGPAPVRFPPWLPRPAQGARRPKTGAPPRRPLPASVPPLSSTVARELAAAARETGLPFALVRAVATVESRGNPWAVSPAGAEGLMQLEPVTAASLGVRDVFNVAQNAQGGARYLAALLWQYSGGRRPCVLQPSGCPAALRLALAAYNAGPGTIRHYGGIPPYPETQRYVTLVTALYQRLTQTG